MLGARRSDELGAGQALARSRSTLRRSALGLVDCVRQARLPAHENVLVVVDQFEELFRFTRSSPASRRRATRPSRSSSCCSKPRSQTQVPIYVVLTMRSDFIGDCTRVRGLPEAVNDGQYLVPRMTREELRAAITGPVAVGGAEIAPRLVQRLLNDVGDDPDQLPVLQHALMRTWDALEAPTTPRASRSTCGTTRRSGRWRTRCRGTPRRRSASSPTTRSRKIAERCSRR